MTYPNLSKINDDGFGYEKTTLWFHWLWKPVYIFRVRAPFVAVAMHPTYKFQGFFCLFFHADPFSEWLSTPMSLPITPDEPLSDNMATSLPPVSCYNSAPTYTAMQAFPNHHAPSPSIPLTPESLVSPESFCSSDEVDEVLSCLSGDSVTPLGANDAFNVFPSPTNAHLYNDNCKFGSFMEGRLVNTSLPPN